MSRGAQTGLLGLSIASWLIVLSSFLIYVAPFWWPGNGNGWVTLVRVGVFGAMLLVVNSFRKQNGLAEEFFCRTLLIPLAFLFAYLLLNVAILDAGGKSYRRLFLLMFFVFSFGFFKWTDTQVRRFAIVIGSIGFFFALYSLAVHYWNGSLPKGYRKGGLTGSGMLGLAEFGNTIVAATHYAASFVFLFYLFFTEQKNKLGYVWFGMLFVVGVFVALTFARAGWIVCLVGAFLIYLQTFNFNSKRHKFVLMVFLGLAVYFITNFLYYELYIRGLTRRDEIWSAVLSGMESHWLTGYGLLTSLEPVRLSSGQIVHNTHNVYLEILYQTGLFGLAAYIVVVLSAIIVLLKSRKLKDYNHGSMLALSALVAVSIVMTTELNSWIHTPNVLWQLLWVPLAYALSVAQHMK